MSKDISANGFKIVLNAIPTFPVMILSHFADDADPFDLPEIDIADGAMSMSGDGVYWSTPKLVEFEFNVIPGSNEDVALNILFLANTASKNKISSKDEVTVSAFYPDGTSVLLTGCRCRGFAPGTSATSSGRKKSKKYRFFSESSIQVIPPTL